MSNGLDDLNARRGARKRRSPPPPQHPRSPQPDPAPAPGPEQEPTPREPQERRRSDARRSGRTPSVEVYLDETARAWLDEVEDAGFARRERAVISPVVRLALRELAGRMSPEEAVAAALEGHRRTR